MTNRRQEDPPATLHLLCGMAGAGKTTLARKLAQESGVIRFSPDEWILALMSDPADRAEMDRLRPPVEKLQWTEAERLLKRNVSVVLENGFWQRAERLEHCQQARRLGVRVKLHLFEISRKKLSERIQRRNLTLEAQALWITEEELDEWLGWLEVPEEAEYGEYDEVQIYRGDGYETDLQGRLPLR